MLKQVLEHGRGIQLARAVDGGMPGQVLVHLVAQKVENVQPQATVRDELAVTD
jgi:hypothetical protein